MPNTRQVVTDQVYDRYFPRPIHQAQSLTVITLEKDFLNLSVNNVLEISFHGFFFSVITDFFLRKSFFKKKKFLPVKTQEKNCLKETLRSSFPKVKTVDERDFGGAVHFCSKQRCYYPFII